MEPSIPFFNILFSIIIFAFIYKIRAYLDDLKNCSCAPSVYAGRIHTIELFYLSITGLYILVTVGSMFLSKKAGNKKLSPAVSKSYLAFMLAYLMILICVHCTFIYNVYEFYRFIKTKCPCAEHWEKDVMYLQAVLYAIPIFIVFLGLFGIMFANVQRLR